MRDPAVKSPQTHNQGISKKQLKHFIVDVDGVLTDGRFYYSSTGKVMKVFGPDDHDALCLLQQFLSISMVTGDKRGYPITKKRIIEDMKFPLELVSTFERLEWMKKHFPLDATIYMGDGIFDAVVFSKVAYSIAPMNAFYTTKKLAQYVTPSRGADSAVAEACLHIMEKFFEPFDPLHARPERVGIWKKQA